MTRAQRIKRAFMMVVWRIINPPNRLLAGFAPWWVIIETTGRRTGNPRRTPLARGPSDERGTWVIAVHGHHAGWVKNLEANPDVRIRIGRRWRHATAGVVAYDSATVARFNLYARMGPTTVGIDPALIRVDFES